MIEAEEIGSRNRPPGLSTLFPVDQDASGRNRLFPDEFDETFPLGPVPGNAAFFGRDVLKGLVGGIDDFIHRSEDGVGIARSAPPGGRLGRTVNLYLCSARRSNFPVVTVFSRIFACGSAGLALLWVAAAPAVVADAVPATADASAGSRFIGSPSWRFTPTATTNTLGVVRVVNRSVVWAAGGAIAGGINDGTVVRTVDGGHSWQNVTPPGGAAQVFRDVEAFDRNNALVLAIGEGDASRIYRTVDGGATWSTVFVNPDPRAFYNCMAFFDDRHGVAMSDPVDGKFRILATGDGGRTWRLAPTTGMPPALTDEYGRATGTCLVADHPKDAWFGTTVEGGNARVFHTQDRGATWTVATTPIPGSPAGIVSLSFSGRRNGLAVGGDPPPALGGTTDDGVVARTADGGTTWSLAGSPAGYRNSVAWIPDVRGAAVTVGPTGSDMTTDAGRTWQLFDDSPLYGVDCLKHVGCWAVGANGSAAKLLLGR